MNNNFNNPDICLDRIKVLYISKNTIDKNDINSIKKAVEKKLEYMAEHLYGEFYEQRFGRCGYRFRWCQCWRGPAAPG